MESGRSLADQSNGGAETTGDVVQDVAAIQEILGPPFRVQPTIDGLVEITASRGLPWWLKLEPTSGGYFPFFTARTVSGDFDGDRTDLHDVLSALLALVLAKDGRSPALVDVDHPVFPSPAELYARHVVPAQPTPYLTTESMVHGVQALVSPLVVLGQLLPRALGMYDTPSNSVYGEDRPELAEWLVAVRRSLRLKARAEDVTTWRENPDWMYFRSARSGTSILHSPAVARFMTVLTAKEFVDRRVNGPDGELLESGGSRNVIPSSCSRKLESFFRVMEESAPARLVALENAVIGVGHEHVALIRANSGFGGYEAGRRSLNERHTEDAAFLNARIGFNWTDPVSPGRFEELILELLRQEHDVLWARASGNVNDRDQGRDLLVERLARLDAVSGIDSLPIRTVRIVGQCKARRGGVNKSDVADIGDTLLRHNAEGFFLAVSSYITSDLATWLDERRLRSHGLFEWWGRSEIEHRLRRNSGTLARFSDVVVVDAPG